MVGNLSDILRILHQGILFKFLISPLFFKLDD